MKAVALQIPAVQRNLLVRLAARDYRHEWLMSTCFVLALSAALVPLLVLFGLKYGIISKLLDPIREDPRYREIVPSGSGNFTPAWFEQMAQRPDVAFIVPKTRSIAATIKTRVTDSEVGRIIDAELIPTATGDPLFDQQAALPAGLGEVIISANVAARLGAATGTRLDGILTRQLHDEQQTVIHAMTVIGVASAGAFNRDGLFVSTEFLTAVEDFRDGRAVAEFSVDGAPRPGASRDFAGFRLFAKSINEVSDLSSDLLAQQIDVRTKAADIELVRALDRNLSIVYWIIAIIVISGFCLSFGTSLWANVNRKAREFSLLRLIGFSARGIVWFPLVQALLTGALGWLLACVVYLVIQFSLNSLFLDNLGAGQAVCKLHLGHLLLALLLTLLAALLAATVGGARVARMELSAGLKSS
ncbi:MAG TPA: FtsX-like permease family protein [Xanthomonadales bacterium]|nr:FtsX-like permease family protein [Xanthomonadales bacterium]